MSVKNKNMENIPFWYSILSTIFGILFLIGNVVQFVINKKEKDIHKAQVKIWQHHANGIAQGLFIVGQSNQYSSVNDVCQAARVIQPTAHSLFSSLNEERLFSEKEIKEKQLAKERETKELLERLERARQSKV